MEKQNNLSVNIIENILQKEGVHIINRPHFQIDFFFRILMVQILIKSVCPRISQLLTGKVKDWVM